MEFNPCYQKDKALKFVCGYCVGSTISFFLEILSCYLATTFTVQVHSPFTPPSHGRLYSRYTSLEPCLTALKVQTSCPGVPDGGGGSLSGPMSLWSSCFNTDGALIWASSYHLKPVVGLEQRFTVNVSPAWASSVWLM